MFLLAVAKNLLNSLEICSGSSTVLSETVSLSIFDFEDSDPMASLIRSQFLWDFSLLSGNLRQVFVYILQKFPSMIMLNGLIHLHAVSWDDLVKWLNSTTCCFLG